MLKLLVTIVTVVFLLPTITGSLNISDDKLTTTWILRNKENQCRPWTYYDNTLKQCKCYYDIRTDSTYIVRCNEDKTLLLYDNCMTYNEESGTVSISYCPYFKLQGHNISESEPGMIDLPDNISQLNDYMCGPMNRKGVLCSQCIDGYGPSVTSRKFQCSPCSGVWYGVPLYLFLELVPVTIFYTIILF